MRTTHVSRNDIGSGLGDLVGSMLIGTNAYDEGLEKGQAVGARQFRNRANTRYQDARAQIEQDKLQARQSLTPDALSGLSSSLPDGMTGDLASLLLRGDFDVNDWAGGVGALQQNQARSSAMNHVEAAGLGDVTSAALLNAIATCKNMPDLFSRNSPGTLNNFTGETTDLPTGYNGSFQPPSAAMLKLLATKQGEGTDFDGNPMTYVDPAMVQQFAQHFGLPTQEMLSNNPAEDSSIDIEKLLMDAVLSNQTQVPYRHGFTPESIANGTQPAMQDGVRVYIPGKGFVDESAPAKQSQTSAKPEEQVGTPISDLFMKGLGLSGNFVLDAITGDLAANKRGGGADKLMAMKDYLSSSVGDNSLVTRYNIAQQFKGKIGRYPTEQEIQAILGSQSPAIANR